MKLNRLTANERTEVLHRLGIDGIWRPHYVLPSPVLRDTGFMVGGKPLQVANLPHRVRTLLPTEQQLSDAVEQSQRRLPIA